MPLFLRKRATDIRERMDDPDCDSQKLENTYRQFSTINRWLSGWDSVFKRFILPHCTDPSQTYTLLDIGFGGGDIPLILHEQAKKHAVKLQILGIETDPRALDYVSKKSFPESITFRHATDQDLIQENKSFDFVISNHLVHHLSGPELSKLLENTRRLTKKQVIFNDLRRSDLAWLSFSLLTAPAFSGSFIREDGLKSICRSYTAAELSENAGPEWNVQPFFPFRLLLTHTKQNHA